MARRGKKKKSLARRIRRLLFLASATAAIVRFAMARRSKPQPSAPQAPEWAPLRASSTPAIADTVAATTSPSWIAPVDGACPVTHPIKGNVNSGIYHVPGGRFYDATLPERCYRDELAAEADGMRASKR